MARSFADSFTSERLLSAPLYGVFFGLAERPFDLVPNPRFLFLTDPQREALSTLQYGLTGPGGITLLLGEAGTGKTTLARAALAGLGDEHVQCVLISNPTLTRDEFYELLAAGFEFSDISGSKAAFLAALQRHALLRRAAGDITAVMVDEAQSLPDDLLEEIRLLSNVETETVKLLNVVLAGQPELGDRLNRHEMRQLKQRIGLRCALRPFTMAETAAYVAGRLRIAGGSPAEIFTREAIGVLFEASRGIPRLVNIIGENALIGGFAAQVKPVPRAIVEEVVRDFDLVKTPVVLTPVAEGSPAPVEAFPAAGAPAQAEAESAPPGESERSGGKSRRRFSFF